MVQSLALPSGELGENNWTYIGSAIQTSYISIDTGQVSGSLLYNVVAHEVGHDYGLGDCTSCTDTIMAYPITTSSPKDPTGCDLQNAYASTNGQLGSNMTCTTAPPSCAGGAATCNPKAGSWQCPPYGTPPTCGGREIAVWNGFEWVCQNVSPIIIDTAGNGYDLTDADHGVWFDFFGSGQPIQISWTASGSDNAFLVLDRNGNGVIDSAKEMFGNITEQPPSNDPNGFLALAVFDKPENGGNDDGIIDRQDAVFSKLRLWIDKNHNGYSEANELFTLPALGVRAIHLDYRESKFVDKNGNEFRYRARIIDTSGSDAGKIAYDVLLVPMSGAVVGRLNVPACVPGGSGNRKLAILNRQMNSLRQLGETESAHPHGTAYYAF